MSIKCFVLMSFGKTDSEKEYALATYKHFLTPLAKGLGYKEDEIDKADISGKTKSSLAENYLLKLATCELVIADLSDNSASVYYELGIRHALVRKKTIILAPKKDAAGGPFQIAFDVVNDHHIYRYDPDHRVEVLERESNRLIKEISEAFKSDSYTEDSPVFHHIPLMMDYGERTKSQDEQMARLLEENKELRKKLSSEKAVLLPQEDKDSAIDFEAAQQEQQLYGSEILKSLRSIGINESEADRENREKEEEDTAAFVNNLQKINKSRFISASVFRTIADMCVKRKLIAYAQRILECGLSRYPSNDDIRFDLIDLYHESESADLRLRSLQLSEEYYCIKSDDKTAVFTEESKKRPFTSNRLASLFNAYIAMGYYQKLYDISKNLSHIVELEDPRCQALIPRNMAVAEMENGHYNKAVSLFIEAYSKDPSVRTISLLSNTCYQAGKKDVGYLLREFIVAQESSEAQNYIKLLNSILKYEYLPIGESDDGTVIFDDIGVTIRPYEKRILPLLYRAILCEIIDDYDQSAIVEMLTDQFKTKHAKETLDFYHENILTPQWKQTNFDKIEEKLRKDLDFAIVDRIDERIKNLGNPGYANDEIRKIFELLDASDDKVSADIDQTVDKE